MKDGIAYITEDGRCRLLSTHGDPMTEFMTAKPGVDAAFLRSIAEQCVDVKEFTIRTEALFEDNGSCAQCGENDWELDCGVCTCCNCGSLEGMA